MINKDTVDLLIKRAKPLLECGHRANRPQDQPGERIVGFVIGEDDIGLGLSEPLFALDAVVELAAIAATPDPAMSERITKLEGALIFAAILFRKYERMHLDKGTDDGREKAERNRDAAEACESALSHTGDGK